MELRVAFAVHPLASWQRHLLGVRHRDRALLLGRTSDAVRRVGRLSVSTRAGRALIDIVGVPDLPEQLVADQQRAARLQTRAVQLAERGGAQALGWGSALAVVGGRGEAAARAASIPVTTGHAATAWACAELTRQVSARGRVGILGFRGTVGDAVAGLLAEDHEVQVEGRGIADTRRAEALGVRVVTRAELLKACRVVVGAGTTGPSLHPGELSAGTTLLDLANPPSLHPGPRPTGVVVLAGETLAWPGRVGGTGWGQLWRLVAGYEGGLAYACLAEPLVLAAGLAEPAGGRRLDLERVRLIGRALRDLGFRPRLHRRADLRARPAR